MNLNKSIPLFLVWLWLSGIILVLFILEIPPFHFLYPHSLLFLVEWSKLLFISLVLPLFITAADTPRIDGRTLLQIIIFLVLFLPLVIICNQFAGINWLILAGGHIILLLLSGLLILLSQMNLNALRWYYFIFLCIVGGMPVLYYLIRELGHQNAPGLLYLNPFWLVSLMLQGNVFYSVWLIQVVVLAGLISLCIGIRKMRSRHES